MGLFNIKGKPKYTNFNGIEVSRIDVLKAFESPDTSSLENKLKQYGLSIFDELVYTTILKSLKMRVLLCDNYPIDCTVRAIEWDGSHNKVAELYEDYYSVKTYDERYGYKALINNSNFKEY